MTKVISGEASHNDDLLQSMFELRHHVFVERLGWNLNSVNGREIDQFDGRRSIYLVVANPRGRAVAACRLLPTTGHTLLHDVFPFLVDDARTTNGARIWEASRLVIDHRKEHLAGCGNVCGVLLSGIMEYALDMGLSHLVAVSDERVERLLERAGWQPRRLGQPHKMGRLDIMGEIAEVTPEALARIRGRCGVAGTVFEPTRDQRVAA